MLINLRHNRPLGITLIYLLLGLMWIVTSDQIALLLVNDSLIELTSYQIIKGSVFIIVTALILFLLIRNLYKELNTHKEDLNLLFSNPDLGILKINEKGSIQEASNTICTLLGFSKMELLKMSFRDITHPDDQEIADYYFSKIKSGDYRNFHYEKRLIKADDTHVWVEVHGTVKRKKNAVDYLLISVQNINDRKISEHKLKQELREKNALINNTNDILFSVDRDLKLVSFNEAFKDLFQKGTGHKAEKGASALPTEYSRQVRDNWEMYFRRALKGDQLQISEEFQLQEETIITENTFHPIRKDKAIVGVSVFTRDVTELKNIKSKFVQQKEYLQVLTDHASDAILAIDTEENIQYSNQTFKKWNSNKTPSNRLKDWPEQFGIYSIWEGRLLKKEELAIWKALHERKVETHEFMIKRPGEDVRYIQANGSALYDSEDHIIGAMVVMRDITERIDKEVQLTNKLLNSLEEERTLIASELHNGITQLMGAINMNLKNIAIEEPGIKGNKRFHNAMNLLQIAIEECRNLSHRIMPKSIQDFGLVVSLQELVKDLKETTDLNIQFQYNKDIRFSQDAELNAYRIVQEAINNGLAHAEASTIQINLNFENNHLRMCIQDDGCGFDPKEAKDFGIGLRAMKNRARKMEAMITITSSDEGTSVKLDVPIKRMINNED